MDLIAYRDIARAFPYVRQVYLDAWGEPLLHPSFWEMVALAREAGCSVGLTTNGTLMKPQAVERIVRNLDVVGISMDGATPEVYESIRVGAKFETVVENVRALIAARKSLRPDGLPLVSLLFLKTRQNIHDLPAFVDLAGELGVNEVIASNLTYVTMPEHEVLRAFSLHSPSQEYVAILDQARQRAKAWNLGLRLYPLEPKRVPFCEANPLQELHITWDGFVSPCVYLTLPVKGDTISRVYEGCTYRIPQTRFGNVREEELLDIWHKETYQQFRQPFARRLAACGAAEFGVTEDGGFQEVDAGALAYLERHPLPDVCRSCYKARGI